jgi:hypothetical protein
LIVVTNNLREFSRMPGVRVESWARARQRLHASLARRGSKIFQVWLVSTI